MYEPQEWNTVHHFQPTSSSRTHFTGFESLDEFVGFVWEEERISRRGNRVLSGNNYETMQSENTSSCYAVWTCLVRVIVSPDGRVLHYESYTELRTGI
jgi:hypothetical protein